MKKKVVIVGGGIIGLSCAYYLIEDGHEVVLIEKNSFNSGASIVNAGYLIPSHIIPLASPEVLKKGIKWMLNSNSPFYIKPRFSRDLINWGYNFIKSSSSEHVNRSIRVIKDINELSKELYFELRDSKKIDFEIYEKGLLMAFKTSKAEKEELKTVKIARELEMNVQELSKEQVNSMQPKIKMNIKGAFWYKSDAHLTPQSFMINLKSYLLKKGLKVYNKNVVESFDYDSSVIDSIKTNKNEIIGDEFVLAAGAWSENLLKKLKIKLLIQPGKGYSIDFFKKTGISYPVILLEDKVAVTPMDGFTRFGGTMEISGLNTKINLKRANAIAKSSEKYYDGLKIPFENINDAKCGLRPLSPDGLPFIGRHSSYKNLVIASGHSMMGWSLGPVTGKLVSEIISNKKKSISIEPFNPERKFGY
ncbi:MAG: amino acid dehydrogenase [Flavobacteriaceae bacterium]|nr:amino acid dehydrogenase [Flavobacteriaceae bacterium]